MNSKRTLSITASIGILTIVLLAFSACAPAAAPSPTPIPATPTPILPTAIPTPDLISLVQAYEEAFNAHDLEATVALFTDLAVFQGDWIVAIFKADIQVQHDYAFGLNQEVLNSECAAGNNTVTCKAVIHDDCIALAEMDGFRISSIEYAFEDQMIQKVTSVGVSEDIQTSLGFYQDMFGWSAAHRREEYSQLTDENGSSIINQATGRIVAKLCQEYAAANP